MTAEFPDAIYSPRTKANRPGVIYTPTKTTVSYAEDIQKLDAEVVAIENILGENPQGTFATVLAWLTDIATKVANILTGIFVDENGKIGIGTETTTYKVNIEDTQGGGIPILRINNLQDVNFGFCFDAKATNLGASKTFIAYALGTALTTKNNGYLAFYRAGAGSNDNALVFGFWGSDYLLNLKADGRLGLGTNSPNANAIFDITSTTKAFMPPRMTTTQRDAIPSPTEGMVIFNITTHVLNFYYTSWQAV